MNTNCTFWTIQFSKINGNDWSICNYDSIASSAYSDSYEAWNVCGQHGFLSE